MNNLQNIILMIESLGGCVSLEELTIAICKKEHIVYSSHLKSIILDVLNNNSNLFKYNRHLQVWTLDTNLDNYLTIDDNKYFKTEQDVLNEVFGFSLNGFQRGSKMLSDGRLVWFPQNGSSRKSNKWENKYFAEDNKWVEVPLTDEARNFVSSTSTGEVRIIFVHEAEGYRFTGIFKHTNTDENKIRTYTLIDDKVKYHNTKTIKLFYEPVNLNIWNLFDKVKGVGHQEYFLATQSMTVGDYILCHVGTQVSKYESGIYAVAKILEKPNIYLGDPTDFCYKQLSVKTEIVVFSNTPIITHQLYSKYDLTFRSVHQIQEKYYDELRELLSI